MIHGAFHAMGTTVEVWSDTRSDWDRTQSLFEDVESELSRFRPDSALNRLNDDPRSRVPLVGRLRDVLEVADGIRFRTDGLVDAGVGSAVVNWGYDRTFDEIADLAARPDRESRPEWRTEGGAVVRTAGTRFDLGGIGKGWTADLAVDEGFARVVSAGGDIRSDDPTTVVPVVGPDGETVATIPLGIGALATSSTARRHWKVGGETVSHLIDPRTSEPVRSPVVSATVVAATAADAEAGAKAVLLRGVDGLAWASSTPWIRAALVIWNTGSVFATSGLGLAA